MELVATLRVYARRHWNHWAGSGNFSMKKKRNTGRNFWHTSMYALYFISALDTLDTVCEQKAHHSFPIHISVSHTLNTLQRYIAQAKCNYVTHVKQMTNNLWYRFQKSNNRLHVFKNFGHASHHLFVV